jgi:hypothetical protein
MCGIIFNRRIDEHDLLGGRKQKLQFLLGEAFLLVFPGLSCALSVALHVSCCFCNT